MLYDSFNINEVFFLHQYLTPEEVNSQESENQQSPYTDTETQFFESIKNAINQKVTLCFGTKPQLPIRGKGAAGASGEGNSDGILTSHAYTILGHEQYKIGGQEIKFLRVRNPHGGNIAKYIYDQ